MLEEICIDDVLFEPQEQSCRGGHQPKPPTTRPRVKRGGSATAAAKHTPGLLRPWLLEGAAVARREIACAATRLVLRRVFAVTAALWALQEWELAIEDAAARLSG